MESEVRSGATRFYHSDLLGTNNVTTDSSGAISSTLDVDPFGNTEATGTTGTSGTQSPFGYAGQAGYQTDADSGLMRVGYRYYDPSTGRFLSRDPVRAGYNWYTYCGNDPINRIDPTGLWNFWEWVKGIWQPVPEHVRPVDNTSIKWDGQYVIAQDNKDWLEAISDETKEVQKAMLDPSNQMQAEEEVEEIIREAGPLL